MKKLTKVALAGAGAAAIVLAQQANALALGNDTLIVSSCNVYAELVFDGGESIMEMQDQGKSYDCVKSFIITEYSYATKKYTTYSGWSEAQTYYTGLPGGVRGTKTGSVPTGIHWGVCFVAHPAQPCTSYTWTGGI